MFHCLGATKFIDDADALEDRMDRLLTSKFRDAAHTMRVVTSGDWKVMARAADGSWENYVADIVAVNHRPNKPDILGTMTVRVYFPLPAEGPAA